LLQKKWQDLLFVITATIAKKLYLCAAPACRAGKNDEWASHKKIPSLQAGLV
jgi:hypothetical protein